MATSITIEGSPAEQARVLKLLQRYGLINHHNEITPDQADSFDTFNKCQEMLNATLERHHQESQALIKELQDRVRVKGERCGDLQARNNMLRQSVEAKDHMIRHVRTIVQERERELDDTEIRASILEDKLADANKLLAKKTEQLEMKVADVTDVVLSNLDGEMQKVVEDRKELEETVEELEAHQRTLSSRIFKLREEHKMLQLESEHQKRRMELQENRLEKLTKENQSLKRSRDGDQVEESAAGEEPDSEEERVHKRRKLD